MSIRVSWDRYEVALLFAAYERMVNGSDSNAEALQLSKTLRELAIRKGISIDDTYRNLSGMKMMLANVQYLFTDGEKGLSGASSMIRQMYELSITNPAEYQMLLKEATQMTGNITTSVEDAFFAYAKGKTSLQPAILADCLRKAADYCHLKQPLLGMTDVKAVRNVQQKVAEGKLLRFRFGKDAQIIRNVTRLYYVFIKSYRESKEEPVSRSVLSAMPNIAEQSSRDAVNAPKSTSNSLDLPNKTEERDLTPKAGVVDFRTKADYSFTTPYSVSYFGNVFATTSWQQVYMTILACLFDDYPDRAEKLKGKTTKGGRRILFGDKTQAAVMLAAKSVDHTGIYADTNFSATREPLIKSRLPFRRHVWYNETNKQRWCPG